VSNVIERLMGPLLAPSASAERRFRTISTVPRLGSPSSSDKALCLHFAEFSLQEAVECFLDDSAGLVW
jgi:hypothetical protein